MLDDDDGDSTGRDGLNHSHSLVDLGRIQPSIDLIKHKDARVHCQTLRQLKPFAIGQRQFGRGHVLEMRQLGEFQTFNRLVARLPHTATARVDRTSHHVFQHGHFGERLDDLKGARDSSLRDGVWLAAGQAFSLESHIAAAKGNEA
jgi:hypothetical protein